jgi:hypothetical protein
VHEFVYTVSVPLDVRMEDDDDGGDGEIDSWRVRYADGG